MVMLNSGFHLVVGTVYLFLVLKVTEKNCNIESLSAFKYSVLCKN